MLCSNSVFLKYDKFVGGCCFIILISYVRCHISSGVWGGGGGGGGKREGGLHKNYLEIDLIVISDRGE